MSSRVGEKAEFELALSSIKSKVLKDFGFKVFFDNKGVRNTVKETVICLHCFSDLQYTGSTANMSFHVQRHHCALLFNYHALLWKEINDFKEV